VIPHSGSIFTNILGKINVHRQGSVLSLEGVRHCEMLVTIYQTAWRQIPEDSNLVV
jgi:hypothetical protein